VHIFSFSSNQKLSQAGDHSFEAFSDFKEIATPVRKKNGFIIINLLKYDLYYCHELGVFSLYENFDISYGKWHAFNKVGNIKERLLERPKNLDRLLKGLFYIYIFFHFLAIKVFAN